MLRLTSRDAFGNDAAYSAARGAGDDRARATLDSDGANPSLELVARLGDNNDGTYDLTFRPTVVGTYALSATLGGADVPALAGATMTVTHAEAYPPASTTDGVPSVGVAGVGCAFEIIARDQFGNAHHAGDETFTLTVTPPAGAAAVVDARVEPTTDGTHVVTFVPAAAGARRRCASRTRRRASPSYEDTSSQSPRARQNRRGCPSRARARTAASRGRRSRSRRRRRMRTGTPPTRRRFSTTPRLKFSATATRSTWSTPPPWRPRRRRRARRHLRRRGHGRVLARGARQGNADSRLALRARRLAATRAPRRLRRRRGRVDTRRRRLRRRHR